MKKLMLVLALAALCIPAAALAKKPPPRSQVLAAKNASWACKALQLRMGRQSFLAAYGENRNASGSGAMRNAFGKCVSQKKRAIQHARLFEPATLTVTMAVPTAVQSVSLAGTISGGRPIATGTLAGALSVDTAHTVSRAGRTCAPATGTITLTQSSPAGTLAKTLTSATFCRGPAGAALVGRYTLTGTGAFAGKTGTGVELLLAPAGGTAHSVEYGSLNG
jgi:hypothetical protein